MMRTGTPIGRARGLGSARTGTHHWWLERLTSVSTLLLFIWFLVSLLRLPSLDHQTVVEWLRAPIAAVPMLLLIVSTFWHSRLGLQVIADDYVHESSRFAITIANAFFNIALAALAIFSVLKIAFGGGAG